MKISFSQFVMKLALFPNKTDNGLKDTLPESMSNPLVEMQRISLIIRTY